VGSDEQPAWWSTDLSVYKDIRVGCGGVG